MTQGRRIDPETGRTVDVPEQEHFYRCEFCGGLVDMRDLAQALAHEEGDCPKGDRPQ